MLVTEVLEGERESFPGYGREMKNLSREVSQSVFDSLYYSVWDSIRDSVYYSVYNSVRVSLRDSVYTSARYRVDEKLK